MSSSSNRGSGGGGGGVDDDGEMPSSSSSSSFPFSTSTARHRSSNFSEHDDDDLMVPPSVPTRSKYPSYFVEEQEQGEQGESDDVKKQVVGNTGKTTTKTPPAVAPVTMTMTTKPSAPPSTEDVTMTRKQQQQPGAHAVYSSTDVSPEEGKKGGGVGVGVDRVGGRLRNSTTVRPPSPPSQLQEGSAPSVPLSAASSKNGKGTGSSNSKSNDHNQPSLSIAKGSVPGAVSIVPLSTDYYGNRDNTGSSNEHEMDGSTITTNDHVGDSTTVSPMTSISGMPTARTNSTGGRNVQDHHGDNGGGGAVTSTDSPLVVTARVVEDDDDGEDDEQRRNRHSQELRQMEERLRAEFHAESQQLIQQTKQAIINNTVQAQVIAQGQEDEDVEGGAAGRVRGRQQQQAVNNDTSNNGVTSEMGWTVTTGSSIDTGDNHGGKMTKKSKKSGTNGRNVQSNNDDGDVNGRKKKKVVFLVVGCMVVCIGIAAIIGVVVAMTSSSKDDDSNGLVDNQNPNTVVMTTSPTAAPVISSTTSTPAPTPSTMAIDDTSTTTPTDPSIELTSRQEWEQFVISYHITDPDTVSDITTPQGQALDWMIEQGFIAPPPLVFQPEEQEENVDDTPSSSSLPLPPPPESSLSPPWVWRSIQIYTLVSFYYATNGPLSWYKNYGFLTPTSSSITATTTTTTTSVTNENHNYLALLDSYDVCAWNTDGINDKWEGIFCNGAGIVTKIMLSYNGLDGTLISELGQLTSLREIYLAENYLHGTLQMNEENMNDDGSNDNESSIAIASTPNVEVKVSSLSTWSSLVRLEILHIYRNDFVGTIPTSMATLPNLEQIIAWENNLSGTVPVFTSNSFQVLDLDNNPNIGGVISNVLNSMTLPSTRLEEFWCFNCNLYGTLPSNLGTYTQLRILVLGHNDISGTLPPEMGGLDNTNNNNNDNMITGMVQLSGLNLDHNSIYGPIPTQFGNLLNLNDIRISSNLLSGTVPTELGLLTNLRILELYDNVLTGTIPQQVANLPFLDSLSLWSNRLSGLLPTFENNQNSLMNLDLDWNLGLYGNIEVFFPSLPSSLIDLWCAECDFQRGNISSIEFVQFSNLRTFQFPRANLVGTVPDTMGGIASLTHISLFENGLSGIIPSNLASLPDLVVLELYTNSLSGPLPDFSQNSGTLQALDLDGNALTGRLDDFLLSLPPDSLERLWLGGINENDNAGVDDGGDGMMMISGSIPTQIGNFIHLNELILYWNDITGTIPTEFGLLTSLYRFNAEGNMIAGQIPLQIAQLQSLQVVTLYRNDITGLSPNEVEFCQTASSSNRHDDGGYAASSLSSLTESFITDCDEPMQISCPCCTACWSDVQNSILY